MPALADDDLRWEYDLAGGALMDLGCYALHSQRTLAESAAASRRGGAGKHLKGRDIRESTNG